MTWCSNQGDFMRVTKQQRNVSRHMLMGVVLCAAVLGCSKEEAAPAAQEAATQAAPKVVEKENDATAAMSVDQLRDAASTAYNDNRLYAPAGNNAMELYLALRNRLPGDVSVSGSLSDLLPLVVIATEQSLARADVQEASRLLALIEQTDANHPAVGRLRASVKASEAEASKRLDALKKKEEEQQKRAAQQTTTPVPLPAAIEERPKPLVIPSAVPSTASEPATHKANEPAKAEPETRSVAEEDKPAPQPASPVPAARPVLELKAVSLTAPKYPVMAHRAGVSSSVHVEFTVGVDGSVVSARVVSIDGPRTYHREFEREALAAVKQWTFQPVSQAVTSRRSIEFKP